MKFRPDRRVCVFDFSPILLGSSRLSTSSPIVGLFAKGEFGQDIRALAAEEPFPEELLCIFSSAPGSSTTRGK